MSVLASANRESSIAVFGLEILGSVSPFGKGHLRPDGIEQLSALGMTLWLREDPFFSKNCVVLLDDVGEGYYCLVCSGKDYGKVIYWDKWCDPKEAYPNIPKPEWFEKHPNWSGGHITGKKEDFWVEELDFWIWLIKMLEKDSKRE
jgi:hypothetical protein